MRSIFCLALGFFVACGTTDEGDGSSTSTSSGTASDATDGGSSDTGTSETTGGDTELTELCTTACVRFEECAPTEYEAGYVDDQECIDVCVVLYSVTEACREASPAYLQCNIDLDCADWEALLDDPAGSACAETWTPVMTECSLGG